jgi:hypothetical protein
MIGLLMKNNGRGQFFCSNFRKANWIGHIFCRNCFLKHVTEGKIEGSIEVVEGQGIRCKQLLDDQRKREDTRN